MVDRDSAVRSSLETGDPVPPDWRDKLLERTQSFYARSGQIVISQGMVSTDVYYVVKGKVLFSLISESGRESILRELGAGHIFGELSAIDQLPRSLSVTAIEDCKFARISGPKFQRFLSETPAASQWIIQQLASRVRSLTDKAFQLATMSVSNRVQSELLRLAHDAGVHDNQAIVPNFPTHEKVAARLGTHREAVTKELRLLSKERIVQQTGRKLTILSVSCLQTILSNTQR